MKRRDFLEKWGLSSLKINLGWLNGEFAPHDPDREAAPNTNSPMHIGLSPLKATPCLKQPQLL
jgi:hypothetical protein